MCLSKFSSFFKICSVTLVVTWDVLCTSRVLTLEYYFSSCALRKLHSFKLDMLSNSSKTSDQRHNEVIHVLKSCIEYLSHTYSYCSTGSCNLQVAAEIPPPTSKAWPAIDPTLKNAGGEDWVMWSLDYLGRYVPIKLMFHLFLD
ncbi:hypothetical protein DER45DRAFT_352076 [Fusarium avenaceum]|nr:hypothetical protein DER45DRAFT_352076 [Fusarium avenaceum]